MTDFDRAAWKYVLKESRDEFDSRQSDTANFLRAVVAIAETDHAVVEGFKPAVGDGDAENVTPEVVEHLIAASGMLRMNDPVFLPHRYGRVGEQSRAFQSRTEFRAEDDRQGTVGNQEFRMFGAHPGLVVRREAACGDQHVDVRVEQHGARPCVKDGQSADSGAEILGIGCEFLQGSGGGFHQEAVDFLRMSAGERPQIGGQSESDQKVGTRRKAAALFVDPAFGLRLVTLRATAVATGVIGKDFLLAMTTLVDVASQQWRPAGGDIAQSPFLNRTQGTPVLPEIRLTVEADNLGHLQHEDLGFRGPSSIR